MALESITEIELERFIPEIIAQVTQKTPQTKLPVEANVSVNLWQLNDEPNSVTYHLKPKETVYYPASLIKLFHAFMAKAYLVDQIPQIVKERTPESTSFGKRTVMDDVYDAVAASLRFSDNDALGYLVDFNSKTNSGLRMEPDDFAAFKLARTRVNDMFKAKGYSVFLNIANKCFSFAPYGRDQQLAYEEEGCGRNTCIIEDIARIMLDIRANFSDLMLSMKRDISNSKDEQVEFIGAGLEFDRVKSFYSKAGWTSAVRHDTAFIELMNGEEYLLTVLTRELSHFPELIPAISKEIFKNINT